MNHAAGFQKLNMQLRAEIEALQAKGYYGDGEMRSLSGRMLAYRHHTGLWSSGRRLISSETVASNNPLREGDFPEYICGGGIARQKPQAQKRRRKKQEPGDAFVTVRALKTARKLTDRRSQPITAGKLNKRKRKQYSGTGSRLDGTSLDTKGVNFRKSAHSKAAVAARLQAAESRACSTSSRDETSSDDSSDVDLIFNKFVSFTIASINVFTQSLKDMMR